MRTTACLCCSLVVLILFGCREPVEETQVLQVQQTTVAKVQPNSAIEKKPEPTESAPEKEKKQKKYVLGKGSAVPVTIVCEKIDIESKYAIGWTNIQVLKIDGVATQEFITLTLTSDAPVIPESIHNDKTYELRGYEVDKRKHPYSFRPPFYVLEAKEVEPVVWHPADFVGRRAFIAGTAKNENDKAIIQSTDWKLVLDGLSLWEDWQVDKRAEALGTIRQSDEHQKFIAVDCNKWLVNLKDQLGRKVSIRGLSYSINNDWFFCSREIKINVIGMDQQNSMWRDLKWDRMIEVTGTLEMMPPPHDYYSSKDIFDGKCFTLRDSSWKQLEGLEELENNHWRFGAAP